MDQSKYLIQALQGMGQQPDIQSAAPPDLAAMQKAAAQRKTWEAANPGQSYAMNGLRQIGQNLASAPQQMAAAPGNAMDGLQALAARFSPRP